jgi:hypothetical protein
MDAAIPCHQSAEVSQWETIFGTHTPDDTETRKIERGADPGDEEVGGNFKYDIGDEEDEEDDRVLGGSKVEFGLKTVMTGQLVPRVTTHSYRPHPPVLALLCNVSEDLQGRT